MKLRKVSICLVLSLQTNVLANDEISVLPLLIGMYVDSYVIEHGLKILNLHSRKSYQIGKILLTKNDKCDYCSETFGFD